MAAYWWLTTEQRGLVLIVEATINGTHDAGWAGEVTSLPFTHLATTGGSHSEVREQLARDVLAEVTAGILPVPGSSVDAVRILSTSATTHLRGGEADGPVITVPAIAERGHQAWRAQTHPSAGLLAGRQATGPDMAAARDELATSLMMDMEIGIEGIPANWSGIQMLTTTPKTYPEDTLAGA